MRADAITLACGLLFSVYVTSLASRRPRRHLDVLEKRYVLRRILGRGAMGRVFEAHDRQTRRNVAVKMIHASLMTNRQAIERFTNEAMALQAVRHPNVAAYHDAGIHHGLPYVVMELVSGPSLDDYVSERGPLPVDVALRIFCDAARGLAALHRAGIVHRDAKPSNLLLSLDEAGRVTGAKWTDLGLARVNERKITAAGMAVGTCAYMAPEQVVGEDVDASTDLYGLAISLFYALTGQLPFEADGQQSMFLQLTSAAPPISWLVDGVDAAVERIVASGLRKNPRNRYASAQAMLEDMERVLGLREGAVQGAPDVCPDRYRPASGRGWRVYARACNELRL